MEYGKMIAVTGLSGLFELISSKNDGAIVRSLEDKATRFVASRVHNFSHLESIEVYTTRENVNLIEVFQAMKANKKALPDVKDAKALKAYFAEVFPSLDQERVYTSDLKKMVKWFEILTRNEVEFKLTAEPVQEEAPVEAPVAEEAKQEEAPAPKKTARKKKTAEETPAEDGAAEAAPKKKATTRKKKTEE